MASVLIIDDEVGIREWLTEILEDEGYRVTTAANGEEARAQMAAETPDVVLLDIWMPDIDGVSLLKEWVAQYGRHLPAVVMISGHATIETAVEATRLGAFGFLEKPIAMAKLLEVLKRAVEQRRAAGCPEGEQRWLMGLPELVAQPIRQGLEQLRQQRTVLWHFPDPFFEQWLLRHLTARCPSIWLSLEGQPIGVDQLRQWQGKRLLVVLSEPLPKMAAKNLGFLYQHAVSYQIDLVAVASATDLLQQSVHPNLGERLSRCWQHPVELPPRPAVEAVIPEILAAALGNEVGRTIAWSAEERTAIERLTMGNEGTLEAWLQALLPAAEEDRLDRMAIEAALAAGKHSEGAIAPLFALPLKEARESFERLYLERLLARTDLPVQRLAELAGLERTHFYRKLRQLGLTLRRKEGDEP